MPHACVSVAAYGVYRPEEHRVQDVILEVTIEKRLICKINVVLLLY